jgi:hypothetical protein
VKVAKRPPRKRKVNLQSENITRGEHRFILQEVPPIDPIPVRPPGYFANCYSKEEIRDQNRLAKASVIRAPADLE